jgi:GNAT superfamily N-acetyltransferase
MNQPATAHAVSFVEISGAVAMASFQKLILPRAAGFMGKASSGLVAIGAVSHGKPVGFGLFECPPEGGTANLHSICVAGPLRRLGIGRGLMMHAAAKLRQRGCNALAVEFLADAGDTAVQARFLEACGCRSLQPGIHICEGPLTAPSDQRWFHMKLPAAFSVDSWISLTASERRLIDQAAGAEYPEILSPFAEEETLDANRSLLLRYQGKPAGWTLVELLDERTVLFKTMYVYKRHQRLARGVALFAEAIRRIIAEGAYPDGIFFVEHDNEPMRLFMEKYFISPLLRKQVLWRTTMEL